MIATRRLQGGPRVHTPRIVALGTAVPTRRFTQGELAKLFGYGDGLRRSFFLNSGIDARHLYVTAAEPRAETIDEMSARFAEGSVRLGVEAVETCLAQAGLGVADVDFLVTTTCTGRLVPSLDAHLIAALGLRSDVQRVHVGRHGMRERHGRPPAGLELPPGVSGAPGAGRLRGALLDDLLPRRRGGDGGGERDLRRRRGRGPAQHDGRRARDPGPPDADPIRSTWTAWASPSPSGRYRIRLSPEVRRIAPAMMEELTETLLKDHGLTKEDVRFWVLHSAGRRVIENAQALLGLSDDDVAYSRGTSSAASAICRPPPCSSSSTRSSGAAGRSAGRHRPHDGARTRLRRRGRAAPVLGRDAGPAAPRGRAQRADGPARRVPPPS